MTFHERKRKRAIRYWKYVYGWTFEKCVACSGSGYYDNFDSPACSACGGTGKVRVSPPSDYMVMLRLAELKEQK